MKFKKINDLTYLIRLEKGEEIIKTIAEFCQKNDIKAGYLQGIGAIDYLDIAMYNLDKKEYSSKKIAEPLEITSLFGIITAKKIHIHITVGDKNAAVFGGHLQSGIISVTGEIILHKFFGKIDRYKDEKIGLELMDI